MHRTMAAADFAAPSPTTRGRLGIGFAQGGGENHAFGVDHVGLARGSAKWRTASRSSTTTWSVEGSSRMTCACLIQGTASRRALAASVSKAEHHRIGAGAERRGDRRVGRVQLAGDGDPLRAETGDDGEVLDAAGQGVEDFGGLSADDGAIDERATEKQHAERRAICRARGPGQAARDGRGLGCG